MPEVMERVGGKEHFIADLERMRAGAPDWIAVRRKAALGRFLATSLPHRKMEDWRFTNVNPIIRTPFHSVTERVDRFPEPSDVEPFRYSDASWAELVFVDGFFAAGLSRVPKGLMAGSLAEAVASGSALAEAHIDAYLNSASNAYSALNSAFLLDGACVHVPKNTELETPIHLVFVTTGHDSELATHPRNLVVVDHGSKASIVESYVSLGDGSPYLTNAVTEIVVGEGSQVSHYKLLQERANSFHLATTQVKQERDSRYRSFSMCLGGAIGRNELSVTLDGEGADCSLNGLYMTDGDQLIDNKTSIDHAKPHCTSWIGYKGVLADRSHAVFSGKIMVRRGAQKTDSNQLNRNLLLSDKATVDTKPLLEIFADDVKCTHGATVGQPPKELVYYFRTRGMSEAMALGMLTYGFADEVVNQIELDPVRERLERFVFDKYSPVPA